MEEDGLAHHNNAPKAGTSRAMHRQELDKHLVSTISCIVALIHERPLQQQMYELFAGNLLFGPSVHNCPVPSHELSCIFFQGRS